ncbi:hypothetical protein [Streptosporangium lutulentum]|uniref:Ig-like domain-containing protein n=1 Tax=Streptosporangium lutulentum TaxID=1461250 RepID=A0ABT9QT26_9ACTN|nr:hypothetical protein [Streptosporangium lutulentum]MDP9849911.1 hypothetical protein [Streptosporangium lutulentum]
MNTGGANIAGYRLAGHTWVDDLGTWSSAVSADGRPGTALRFDPQLITDRATRDRLVSAVIADRRLAQSGMTGLVPIADLITAQDEIWLLTAAPVSPTVADLLSDVPGIPRPDAGSAATVLVEVAQTLLAVHASGLSHGALHPGTVVIAPDGSALLAERGLADALLGRPPAPERDVAAWASLARGLAAGWAPHDPRSAGLLDRAAATASDLGLAPARDVLLAGRDLLPPGFVTRDRLVEIMRRRAERDMPTQVRRPARTPVTPDQGEIVTLLGAPRPGERPTEDVVMRFGPGVPADTTAAQIWRAGRDQQWTEAPAAGSRAGRVPARQRRGRTILASVILALMVLGGLALWLFRGSSAPLEVAGVDVVAPKKTQGCDTTVKIVGVLSTNGSAGEVRYQWKRSDRKAPITQTDQVMAGKTSHEVSLEWTVKGEGSFKGTATLQVLSPLPQGRKLQDKATFTYKCS